MKDEIKEMITRMASYTIHYDCCSEGDAEKDIDKILDYITDLQERIEKAREYIEKSMNNAQPFYEYLCGDENGEVENLDKLLNMLNGGDE